MVEVRTLLSVCISFGGSTTAPAYQLKSSSPGSKVSFASRSMTNSISPFPPNVAKSQAELSVIVTPSNKGS